MEERWEGDVEEAVTRVLLMRNQTLHPGRVTAGKMLGCREMADGVWVKARWGRLRYLLNNAGS